MLPYSMKTDREARPLPPGEWETEPNVLEFTHLGFECAVLRMLWSGQLNGYIGIGPSHPLYGKDYGDSVIATSDMLDRQIKIGRDIGWVSAFCADPAEVGKPVRLDLLLHCHGGLTYSRSGEPGNNLWWFGFDTAHLGDLRPNDDASRSRLRSEGTYRNLAYVRKECERLAKQLHMYFGETS
jgi:hypothetical protein